MSDNKNSESMELVSMENTEAASSEDTSIDEMFAIELSRPTSKQISYIPSFFTTASLPFRNVNKTVFVRKGSNGIILTLTSPKNVPFGKYGRLLLSLLTTHAVISTQKDSPVYLEYATLSDLLKEMQLPKQRGGDIKDGINELQIKSAISAGVT